MNALRSLPRRATARWRTLPDYLIIGAQKSGTTSLQDSLVRHPAVGRTAGKAVHYFDLHHRAGPAWYRSHFPVSGWGASRSLCGEATPYYLLHPLAPARAAALVPHVKLIAILRNPVDRAYSHYQHERAKGRETLPFADAVAQEEARISGELERLGRDPQAASPRFQRFSYLLRGIYVEQLERWLRHYQREQLLVLEAEDFYTKPARTTAAVFAFLGLQPFPELQTQRLNARSYPPMDEGLRAELDAYFHPHNERLEALLGQSLGWNVGVQR